MEQQKVGESFLSDHEDRLKKLERNMREVQIIAGFSFGIILMCIIDVVRMLIWH